MGCLGAGCLVFGGLRFDFSLKTKVFMFVCFLFLGLFGGFVWFFWGCFWIG